MPKNWFIRLAEKLSVPTIRGRLLLSFVLMTLIPALAISTGGIFVGYSNGRQQVFDQLDSLLSLKEQKIDGWATSLKSELTAALEQEYIFERISVELHFASEDYYLDFYSKSVRLRLQRFLLNAQYFDEISLLDRDGNVVLSTNPAEEGQNHAAEDYFIQGLLDKTVRFVTEPGGPAGLGAVAALPIYSAEGQLVGVITGRANLSSLSDRMNDRTGLGRTGKAYLVNGNKPLLLTASSETGAENILAEKAAAVTAGQLSGRGFYDDAEGTQVVGVYRWLPDVDAALFVEKNLFEVFGTVFDTLKVNLIIALAAVAAAVVAALLVTNSIAHPIMDLSQRAAGIAEGDWSQIEQVDRRDELGILANALNSMMIQLRELINNLEQRVEVRTGQLKEANQALRDANQAINTRALQLETSSTVSREISSILEREVLLKRVAQLIRESFGFYAVNIFLADEGQNRLVLHAFSYSTAGKPENLVVPVDSTSLNGRATLQNTAILENDVLKAPEFQYDPLLPGTQSELVIPLRIAGKMIGTLDVQDARVNAFTPDDLLVFQSLGDQIAVAIENSRLYENNQRLAVLEERNRLARELHDSVIQSLYSLTLLAGGWSRFLPEEKEISSDRFIQEFSEIAQQALKEMRLLVYNLRPPVLEQEGLLGALHARLDAVEKRAGITTRLIANDLTQLDPSLQEGIYRIAQEALNNALKHSNAAHLMLQLSIENSEFLMSIYDNGQGFDTTGLLGRMPGALHHEGLGLISMRERAEGMNGSLQVVSAPGKGTTVKLRVPLQKDKPVVRIQR